MVSFPKPWVDNATPFEKGFSVFAIIVTILGIALLGYVGYIFAFHYPDIAATNNNIITSVKSW